MLLYVVMEGKGTDDDPYRAPLPTWTLRHIDYDKGMMVVDVPDDVYGAPVGFQTRRVTGPEGQVFDVLVPSNKALSEWESMEADRYPQFASRRRLRDILVKGG